MHQKMSCHKKESIHLGVDNLLTFNNFHKTATNRLDIISYGVALSKQDMSSLIRAFSFNNSSWIDAPLCWVTMDSNQVAYLVSSFAKTNWKATQPLWLVPASLFLRLWRFFSIKRVNKSDKMMETRPTVRCMFFRRNSRCLKRKRGTNKQRLCWPIPCSGVSNCELYSISVPLQ